MTQSMQCESQNALFDRWAEVYDSVTNPLLMLEEQTLPPLLPSIPGLYVLDVGCGTGRWLARLAALQPASLLGTDSSAEMLHRARAKAAPTTRLLQSDAKALPVADATQDFILSSFVLSYLEDLSTFACECARVLKPGGYLLLSDMHPETARQRGWTRSFTAEGQKFRIAVGPQQLSRIVKAFSSEGLQLSSVHAPSFAAEQRPAFEEAGRLEEFLALADVPAIYLLKLRKPVSAFLHSAEQSPGNSDSRIEGEQVRHRRSH
jgi:ubiquinone/menaquinone biosynthesis C-methylase UbiE